ncbi:MAG: UrcA family protein [Parvularculaceae bacterium]|nr:UrcA family protein [Parvularculaceae bacterium]
MITKTLTAIAVATTLVMAPAAHAGSFEFSYNASEMDSDKGRKAALKRLVSEARDFCRDEFSASGTSLKQMQACRNETMSVVVDGIDDARFASLFNETIVVASR